MASQTPHATIGAMAANGTCPVSGAPAPPGSLPHALPAAAVVTSLGTDAERGLASPDAAARLEAAGGNRLGDTARPAYGKIALRQVSDPLVALLVVATVVSAAIGESLEAAAIGLIVVLNAALGFFQEAAAERAIRSLRSAFPRAANVVREETLRDSVIGGNA